MSENEPIAALNRVLSEVIDLVQDVKQAHWKVSETHALHQELDQLRGDLGTWARQLIVQDEALGVSPLTSMPSVAGRKPPTLWPGAVSDEDVRQVLGEHLDRLEQHIAAAMADQTDAQSRAVLGDVHRGVIAHRHTLADPQR